MQIAQTVCKYPIKPEHGHNMDTTPQPLARRTHILPMLERTVGRIGGYKQETRIGTYSLHVLPYIIKEYSIDN